VRAVVTCPAVTVALVVSVALAMTSFAPSQFTALAATTPTATTTASPSPTSSPTTAPSATPTTTAATTPSLTAIPSPSSGGVTTPGVAPVNHHVVARLEGDGFQANYWPVDEVVPDAAQFQTFRVRFQMHNTGTAAITVTPQLEYRTEGSANFAVVPENSLPGVPMHVTREWVPSLGLGGGTMEGPLGKDIDVADLRIAKEAGLAVNGHRSMGANPDQETTLPSDSYTEQEFTVSLTIDAQYLTGYELRITNGGTPLAGTDTAILRLGAPPAIQLSPGQHQGVEVGGPNGANRTGVVR
jgi:hypothetical protein